MSDKKPFKFQGYFLLLDLFKDSQENSPYPQSQQAGASLMRIFVKFCSFQVLSFQLLDLVICSYQLFVGKVMETKLETYLIKIAVCSSFYAIKNSQANKQNSLNSEIKNSGTKIQLCVLLSLSFKTISIYDERMK